VESVEPTESVEPAERPTREGGDPHPHARRALLRAQLPPAAGIGALMGVVAAHEGSGVGAAVVVGFVGCAVAIGMLALKRAVSGR